MIYSISPYCTGSETPTPSSRLLACRRRAIASAIWVKVTSAKCDDVCLSPCAAQHGKGADRFSSSPPAGRAACRGWVINATQAIFRSATDGRGCEWSSRHEWERRYNNQSSTRGKDYRVLYPRPSLEYQSSTPLHGYIYK